MDNLLNAIVNDLNIQLYPDETDKYRQSRILYSALIEWIKYIVMDQDIDGTINPKTKNYVLRRARVIFKNLLKLYPDSYDWFGISKDSSMIDDCVINIRDLLIAVGEINIDKNDKLVIPKKIVLNYNCGISRVIGFDSNHDKDSCRYNGCTRVVDNSQDKGLLPFLLSINSITYVNNICKNARWFDHSVIDKYTFYDPVLNSWDYKPNAKYKYQIGRINVINKYYNYYMFYNHDHVTQSFKINDIMIKQRDYIRIILGLRAQYGRNAKAYCFNKNGHVLLQFKTPLPKYENSLLKTYCWPYDSYDSDNSYMIDSTIWDALKPMLNDLCIEIIEKDN